MNKKIFNFWKTLFELWCLLKTWFDDSFNHISKRPDQIILWQPNPHIFIKLEKMRKDFQLSDYNNLIWTKKAPTFTYGKIYDLQRGKFLWNNNLKHAALLFRDSKNNLRMACYNRSKGFVLSSESEYEIQCLLRHKQSYPASHVREYYFAFSEDL